MSIDYRDEHSLRAERDENTARLDREDAARAAVCCPECGSPSGMMDWQPYELRFWIESEGMQFYTHGQDNALYTPCYVCNWPGIIPDAYKPLVASHAPVQLISIVSSEDQEETV